MSEETPSPKGGWETNAAVARALPPSFPGRDREGVFVFRSLQTFPTDNSSIYPYMKIYSLTLLLKLLIWI